MVVVASVVIGDVGVRWAPVRIGVLGPLEVGGGAATLPTRSKERSVLAFLALRAGRPASVADLLDALWGDDPPATAVRSLQNVSPASVPPWVGRRWWQRPTATA